MNPDARAFFLENPDELYWYYNDNIRVPNPALKPWQREPRVPWPSERNVIGSHQEMT